MSGLIKPARYVCGEKISALLRAGRVTAFEDSALPAERMTESLRGVIPISPL